MSSTGEWICSADVESDGPVPGRNSMLSFGAAMFDNQGGLHDIFTSNLELLPGATQHPATMDWWAQHQEAYNATRSNLESPDAAMDRFYYWVQAWATQAKPARIVLAAYRAAYDGLFLGFYIYSFAGRRDPFSNHGFTMLDLKSYAAGKLGMPYSRATKKNFPKEWFDGCRRHSHVAAEDAEEQGRIFFNTQKGATTGASMVFAKHQE